MIFKNYKMGFNFGKKEENNIYDDLKILTTTVEALNQNLKINVLNNNLGYLNNKIDAYQKKNERDLTKFVDTFKNLIQEMNKNTLNVLTNFSENFYKEITSIVNEQNVFLSKNEKILNEIYTQLNKNNNIIKLLEATLEVMGQILDILKKNAQQHPEEIKAEKLENKNNYLKDKIKEEYVNL